MSIQFVRYVLLPTTALLLIAALSGCGKQSEASRQDEQATKELRRAKTGD